MSKKPRNRKNDLVSPQELLEDYKYELSFSSSSSSPSNSNNYKKHCGANNGSGNHNKKSNSITNNNNNVGDNKGTTANTILGRPLIPGSEPKNDSQWKYVGALQNPNHKIIIATGPAGTGKTLFAVEYGVRQFLMGKYKKLIFTRPAVSVEEDLGYLPGTLEEKMAPWIRPIYDILYKFISPSEVTEMIQEKQIEISPIGYMRGRTFMDTWIVADETQNCTMGQFKMLLTRIGENSRMVITGDLDQHDRKGGINGLADFLDKFRRVRSDSITSIEFEKGDIEREEVVKEVLHIYAGTTENEFIQF